MLHIATLICQARCANSQRKLSGTARFGSKPTGFAFFSVLQAGQPIGTTVQSSYEPSEIKNADSAEASRALGGGQPHEKRDCCKMQLQAGQCNSEQASTKTIRIWQLGDKKSPDKMSAGIGASRLGNGHLLLFRRSEVVTTLARKLNLLSVKYLGGHHEENQE